MKSPLLVVALACLAAGSGCRSSRAGGATVRAAPPPPYSPATVDGAEPATDAKIRQSIASLQRSPAERARDAYRHPLETLEFFGLKDTMTVVELSPGGGWYSTLLAPVLRDEGKLVIAGRDPNSNSDARALLTRFENMSHTFDRVAWVVVTHDAPQLGPPESADMVLTLRNLHNWVNGGSTDAIFGAAFAVLKHGGVLGLTDHRANPGASADPRVVGATGYIPEEAAVQLVEKVGFRLAGKSEVNANPKDTKDYPKGVWTLPPSYDLGASDHSKYEAIGESDRMTLKFVKP